MQFQGGSLNMWNENEPDLYESFYLFIFPCFLTLTDTGPDFRHNEWFLSVTALSMLHTADWYLNPYLGIIYNSKVTYV